MLESSPWDTIAIPSTDFNVRRVAMKTATPCFWGRDVEGAYMFIVELQGDHAAHYRKNAVTANGINVDLRTGNQGQQHLILALERQVDRDLFEGLCRTLAEALQHATDSTSSLAISLAHIRRWKTFLSGRNQHLSNEEIRGLFAEIVFLKELIDRRMPSHAAVEAWLGPERSHQDFIYGNTAVEIKSLSGSERNSIRISSEDQLESLNDALFLRIYRLSSLANAKGALSLNEIITSVQKNLDNSKAVEAFEQKLAAHGYVPLPDYDEPRFVVTDIRNYLVDKDFPRLTRSQLPIGITKVAYDIKLEAITQYQCEETGIFWRD